MALKKPAENPAEPKNRGGRPPKPAEERTANVTICMPAALRERAVAEFKRDGAPSLSSWLTGLVRDEVERRDIQRELAARKSTP